MLHHARNANRHSLCMSLFLFALTVFLAASFSFGQTLNASLSGTVTDSSGAVIPGASVIVTNTATGIATKTTSDAAGNYTFPSLPAGNYDLTFQKEGLRKRFNTG